MTSSPHPPTSILKVYIEALTGFSHIHSPDGLDNTLLSQGYVPTVGMVGRVYIPRTGEGVRSILGSARQHPCPLNGLLQQ